MRRLLPLVLGPTRPPVTLGLLVAAACVAVETAVAYPLERAAHASSIVVYLLGVVAVSTLWGQRLGAPTAVVSALAWGYFYIQPQGSLLLIHTRDWVILATFLATTLLVGSVADLARSRALEADTRRQEADLAADLARLLLRTQDLRSALPAAAQCLAHTLELPFAVIELATVAGDDHHTALPLRDGATRRGTLLVPGNLAEPTQRRLRERIVPSVEALLSAAWERQAIGRALETSRDGLRLLAEQQAALRRVATLVARGVSPTQLFAAVASEMGRILQAEFTEIIRHETDGVFTVVGTWTHSKPTLSRPLGSCWPIEPGIVVEALLHTGRPARVDFSRDGYGEGVVREWAREQGITSGVGCPIVVEGHHWGAMLAFSTKADPQPADTEERMREFTKLVATAIANTEGRAELRLLADQQAALRRVATLVARSVSPTQLFAAVAGEMGQILEAECTEIIRYGTDRASYTVVGSWTRGKPTLPRPVGSRWQVEIGLVVELLRTERPVRIDFYRDGYGDGDVATWLRENGITSLVACPIMVEGRQWGAMVAQSTRAEPQPADTEERLREFTELVATAIANTESRDELRLLAEQQAALRRVATLVARGVSPTQLFAAVAGEMGQILEAEFTDIVRYETARAAFTVVGSWTRSNPTFSRRLGSHWPIRPGIVVEVMTRTGRPARIDRYGEGDDVFTWLREEEITSGVGCPIVVEGRQWGAMVAFSTRAEPQPADTEERMREFTELVATAIANTESRAELIASRARIVAAADQTRRRIERDLHDGTQQRLLALSLHLRAAEAATPPELDKLRAQLAHTSRGLTEAVTELQEISRGIHPAILSNGGIGPALETLARRSTIPVKLTVNANQRLAEPVEVAAYYIVSEALTNATKHAHASVVHAGLNVRDATLRLWVRDDGDGGADPDQGSGLTGLRDRVEALNGTIEISSPTGGGTSLTVEIPIDNDLPTTRAVAPVFPAFRAGEPIVPPRHPKVPAPR